MDLVPRQGAGVCGCRCRASATCSTSGLLEPAAIRQATEAAAADPELRRAFLSMREFVRIQRRAPSQARSRAFYELADRFDWAVIGATRNEHLRRTIAELPHTARLRNLSHVDPQRVDVSVAEHLVICDALLRGDADEAADRTAEHLARACDDLPQPGPRPGPGLDLLARAWTEGAAVACGSVARLHRQHRAVRVEQDALRLAAGDELAGRRPPAQADDDQAGLDPVGRLDELLGRLVAAHHLVDLVRDAGLVQPRADAVEGVLEA